MSTDQHDQRPAIEDPAPPAVPGPRARPASSSPRPERVMLVAGGDDASLSAADWVARRARQRRIEVSLVSVPDTTHADGLRRVQQHLHRIAPDVSTAGVQIPGPPARAFVEAASRQDLLVVGTNRVPPFAHMLPPTLAVHLAEAAQGPVVLVPRGWTEGTGPIVAGATGDGTDSGALSFAAAEAEALGRPLHLVHVWRMSEVVTPVLPWAIDASPLRADHAARLDAIATGIRREFPQLEVTTALVHGEASVEVVHAGAGAELVVVGSHGWSPVDRVLLRSVGRALARRPPCTVAVVPPRPARTTRASRGSRAPSP